MNILPLIMDYEQLINNFLSKNPYFYQIESKIKEVGDELTIDILREIIEFIDITFKNSNQRKDKYYVHKTMNRTIITSIGLLTFTKTYYRSKKKYKGKYEFFSFVEEILGIEKWAKMTINAEVALINMATETNMEYASKNAIRNHIVSRQAVSTKVRKLNINQPKNIIKSDTNPDTLYIEMDEIHANLQSKKNKIVPTCIIHEGHKEDFVKRKELLNPYYISSSYLNHSKLWYEIYNYCDLKYDLDKIKYIFVSGDGNSGIKNFNLVFPNALYVLDKFHYKKALNYIFKRNSFISKLADDYLRHDMINEFKELVKLQIKLFPHQEKELINKQNYLINNLDGIKNQLHPMYKTPCSMEGTISHKYARHITSRPFAFSKDGLENKIQLLTFKANGYDINVENYIKFKYEDNYFKHIDYDIDIKWRHNSNLHYDSDIKYLDLIYDIPILSSSKIGTRNLISSILNSK